MYTTLTSLSDSEASEPNVVYVDTMQDCFLVSSDLQNVLLAPLFVSRLVHLRVEDITFNTSPRHSWGWDAAHHCLEKSFSPL